MAEKKLANALLIPGQSITQFVVEQLLKGIEVLIEVNGKNLTGYVHQLDFSVMPGNDYVFASVCVPDPDDEEGGDMYIRVSIHTDGTVKIAPNQPDGA